MTYFIRKMVRMTGAEHGLASAQAQLSHPPWKCVTPPPPLSCRASLAPESDVSSVANDDLWPTCVPWFETILNCDPLGFPDCQKVQPSFWRVGEQGNNQFCEHGTKFCLLQAPVIHWFAFTVLAQGQCNKQNDSCAPEWHWNSRTGLSC